MLQSLPFSIHAILYYLYYETFYQLLTSFFRRLITMCSASLVTLPFLIVNLYYATKKIKAGIRKTLKVFYFTFYVMWLCFVF